jgi:rod shape-determining protein MreC
MIRDTTTTRALLATLLLTTVGAAVVDSRSSSADSPLAPVRTFAARVFGPVESGVVWVARPVAETVTGIGRAHSRQTRIDALAGQNARLAAQLATTQQQLAGNGARTALTEAARTAAVNVRPAHVIGVAPDRGYSWSVAIDLGSDDGVAPDTAVLDAAGLVGRVTSVTPHTATVVLLLDPISSVGVRSASSGQIGTLTGTGDDLCRLTMFDPRSIPAVGEDLRTFGSRDARPYTAGIPVGKVVSVTRRPDGATILVRPYTGFGDLDTVGVVVPPGTGASSVTAAGPTS